MKTKKLKLFITIISPIIIVYLLFAFVQLSFSILNWSEETRIFFVMFIIFSNLFLLPLMVDWWFKNHFQYDELEEMKKKNTTISEMNQVARRQLELLKQSDDIRKETKDLFSKNKI